MKAGFIGAGKVGFSLGKYFAANGARPADKSSQESARPAGKPTQEGRAAGRLADRQDGGQTNAGRLAGKRRGAGKYRGCRLLQPQRGVGAGSSGVYGQQSI